MLIQFRFRNFKSFKDDAILDLSASKITEMQETVFDIGNERILVRMQAANPMSWRLCVS